MKTFEIINQLEGLDEETKKIVGTEGQVLLLKKYPEKQDICEFYDDIPSATLVGEEWINTPYEEIDVPPTLETEDEIKVIIEESSDEEPKTEETGE